MSQVKPSNDAEIRTDTLYVIKIPRVASRSYATVLDKSIGHFANIFPCGPTESDKIVVLDL